MSHYEGIYFIHT